ncbi:MAG: hypothetical protein ACPHP1_04970 [Miltoncostaeaceae bacterium]
MNIARALSTETTISRNSAPPVSDEDVAFIIDGAKFDAFGQWVGGSVPDPESIMAADEMAESHFVKAMLSDDEEAEHESAAYAWYCDR